MSKHGSTIRQVRNAVNLVIGGGLRQIESCYPEPYCAECITASNELIDNAMEELNSWARLDPGTGVLIG